MCQQAPSVSTPIVRMYGTEGITTLPVRIPLPIMMHIN